MDPQRRNLIILVVLLVGWGLIFAFRSPWGSPAKPQPRGNAGAIARRPAAQGGGLPRLRKELLDPPRPAYPPEVQNFFGSPPPQTRPGQAAATAPTPSPPPPDPFQEEVKRLRYVGYLQAGERGVAFIVHGQEVYTVEVGSTFLERFRVQAVTDEAVLLSSVTGDKEARLPLVPEAGTAPKR